MEQVLGSLLQSAWVEWAEYLVLTDGMLKVQQTAQRDCIVDRLLLQASQMEQSAGVHSRALLLAGTCPHVC